MTPPAELVTIAQTIREQDPGRGAGAAAASLAASTELPRPTGLVDYGGEEDMLLAEWSGEDVVLSRQWIFSGGCIWQLQIRLHFSGQALPAGSTDWQLSAESFLTASAPLVALLHGGTPADAQVGLDPQ